MCALDLDKGAPLIKRNMAWRKPLSALAAVTAASAVIAGCGGSDSPAAAGSTTTATTAAASGETLFLKSAIAFDDAGGTVTLPIFAGKTAKGADSWYVVTESSDKADAEKRGVNYAPKLANAIGTKAVQKATASGDVWTFAGTVDFMPERSVTPGPDGFPPAKVAAGAIGDSAYSPLVTVDGKTVLNATQVKNDTGQLDAITTIDTATKQVTLKTLHGYSGGQKVAYLRLDASVDVVAALEESVLAPNLNAAPGEGVSDPAASARSAIIPIVNGTRGKGDPNRQGLQSAVLGEGEPLNIQASLPGDPDYSPVWDVVPAVWSDGAVKGGKRTLVKSVAEIAAAATAGDLTSGGEATANADLGGLKSAGFISNCPAVAIVPE
jgi:hypothetical protein